MRTFKGSDKLYVSQAAGTLALVASALILRNQDFSLNGGLWLLAGLLGLFLLARWFLDERVHGLSFDEDGLEIQYRRRRVRLKAEQIQRIESVGSVKVPAWFVYADNQRYLVQTQSFPHWIRLQILDQMQKFRTRLG
ncbi:hypothetical protein PVT67_03915 [Gallaecimonas kandeliae]|uniref:hypothetical protein n=1 Tax=Gallaecimonas kandeliae TaxID=3029055 RepID=UPI0026473D52|nr:hypothetical protein [Gallaecimonas kandeliae]WKE66408.1 hypothetical protein PVT67_03915 [Gallaecimonas kandeliae]